MSHMHLRRIRHLMICGEYLAAAWLVRKAKSKPKTPQLMGLGVFK